MQAVTIRLPPKQVRGAPSVDLTQSGAQGDIWTAVCWIIDQEKGGVMQPRDACTKTDELVIGVLCYKQPDACSYSDSNLSAYPGQPPDLVLVKLTKDTVIEVPRRLSGGDGMGGIDFIRLQRWLVQIGGSSGKI